ncbi:MAG: CrcB family protein [Acidobacteriota bacterium]
MILLLWVAVGGILGALIRSALEELAARIVFGSARQRAFLANLFGAALLGSLLHVGLSLAVLSQSVRIGLAAGILGGFTTSAAFNNETLQLFRQRSWGVGLIRLVLDTLTCLTAGILGLTATRWLLGA